MSVENMQRGGRYEQQTEKGDARYEHMWKEGDIGGYDNGLPDNDLKN